MRAISFLLAAVAIPIATIAAVVRHATVLTDLDRLTTAAYHDYMRHAVDKFAPDTVDSGASGKAFKMVLPVGDGDSRSGDGGTAYYSYDKGRLTFNLSPAPESDGSHIVVGPGRTVSASSYVGQNGYGARARVQSTHTLARGIAMIEVPKGESTSPFDGIGDMGEGSHEYWYRVVLPGPEAKRLALDTDLVVEGQFAPLASGKLASCTSIVADATVEDPHDVFATQCFAGARITSIAFVRRSTGAVVKRWE